MNLYTSQKIRNISFILMVMVVFIHSYNIDIKQSGEILFFEKDSNWFIQNFISNGLTRIAVPLFFLISGYFFALDRKMSISNLFFKIKKRISTLMIPYLLWAILGLLLYYTLQTIPQSQAFFTKQLIKDYSFSQWVNAIFNEPIPYQLWFLKDLIVMVILSPIIFFCVKNLRIFYLAIVFVFWFFNQDAIFLTSEGLLFFSLGMYISTFKPELIEFKNKRKIVVISLWITLLLVKTIIAFYQLNVLAELIFLKLSILVGIVAFWNLYDCYIFKKIKLWDTMIGFSFFLYLFHEPFLTITNKLLFSQLPKLPEFYLLVYFLAPLITILVSLILGFFVKSNLNSVYRLLTGNR